MAFLVDLHVHTREASACASQSVEEMITRARMVGLQGVAVTDHNLIEGALKAQRFGRRRNFRVFVGVEVLTEEIGDVLVYGLRKDFPDAPVPLRKLARLVEREKAVMFAAHPFRRHNRQALWSYLEEIGFNWRYALELPDVLKPLTGVEVFNAGATPEENEAAALFAARFRLLGIAGSDAHSAWRVGWCATAFEYEIATDIQLAEALRLGRFKIARNQSEFDNDAERRTHLKAITQLRGPDLETYYEDWMRRKQRKQ